METTLHESIGRNRKEQRRREKDEGLDEIRNEAWKCANEKVKERLTKIMNGIWKIKEWPEDWEEGIICPIYKKGEKVNASKTIGE